MEEYHAVQNGKLAEGQRERGEGELRKLDSNILKARDQMKKLIVFRKTSKTRFLLVFYLLFILVNTSFN